VMPGAVWGTWEPRYADPVVYGRTVTDLAARLTKYLADQPATRQELTSRRMWRNLGATKIPRETHSKASKDSLSRNHQLKQQDQWYRRVS